MFNVVKVAGVAVEIVAPAVLDLHLREVRGGFAQARNGLVCETAACCIGLDGRRSDGW